MSAAEVRIESEQEHGGVPVQAGASEEENGGAAGNHVASGRCSGGVPDLHREIEGRVGGAVDRSVVSDSEDGGVPGSARGGGDAPDPGLEIDSVVGGAAVTGTASDWHIGGVLDRYIDVETATLRALGMTWKDLQGTRKALAQRGADPKIVEAMATLEAKAGRQLQTALRRHPLWPWLKQYPGLGGVHVALVMAAIGDPRRFPGRRCTEGCYLPAEARPGIEELNGGAVEQAAGDTTSGPAVRVIESDSPSGGADGPPESEIARGPAEHLHVSDRPDGGADIKDGSDKRPGPADPVSEIDCPCGGAETADVIVDLSGPADPGCEIEAMHGGAEVAFVSEVRRGPAVVCAEVDGRLGGPCPTVGREGPCSGTLLPPRRGTGVRSVYHYLGLHTDDEGRSPRKKKGQRVSWDPIARSSVLQPDGIADQIVRLRVPKYRDIYDAQKARLILERAGRSSASATSDGPEGRAVNGTATEQDGGPPLIALDRIARKIAAKAFVGDLVVQWKKIAAESSSEIEITAGGNV